MNKNIEIKHIFTLEVDGVVKPMSEATPEEKMRLEEKAKKAGEMYLGIKYDDKVKKAI